MDESRKQQIISALQMKGATQPCPRCLHTHFTVVGGGSLTMSDNPTEIVLGGQVIPVAIVVCTKCGFVTQHALGSLGISFGGF